MDGLVSNYGMTVSGKVCCRKQRPEPECRDVKSG